MCLNITIKNIKEVIAMEQEVVCPICWKHTEELLESDEGYMCEECYLEEIENKQGELS